MKNKKKMDKNRFLLWEAKLKLKQKERNDLEVK